MRNTYLDPNGGVMPKCRSIVRYDVISIHVLYAVRTGIAHVPV